MCRLNELSLFICVILLHNEVIVSVGSMTSQNNGFALRQLNGSPMTSLKCSASHLPNDATGLFSINIAYRPMSQVLGKSSVVGFLKNTGE